MNKSTDRKELGLIVSLTGVVGSLVIGLIWVSNNLGIMFGLIVFFLILLWLGDLISDDGGLK